MRLIDLNKIPHKAFRGDRDDLVDALLAAPTVDAVPVVRCRECIEFVKYRSAKGGLCKNTGCCTSEDFYCADGERKGGHE